MARKMRADTNPQADQIAEPKRRGRPSKHPLPFDTNVTDETIAEFGNRALTYKLEHEKAVEEAKKANGAYRGVLKEAKQAGVDPDAVVWYLKVRKMEPDDLTRQISWQNRVARVMQLPIGTQLGFDPDTGETIAHVVDDAALKKRRRSRRKDAAANGQGEADPRAAYVLGYDAGKLGKSPAVAGKGLTGEAATQFQAGWQQGNKDAAKELGPAGVH